MVVLVFYSIIFRTTTNQAMMLCRYIPHADDGRLQWCHIPLFLTDYDEKKFLHLKKCNVWLENLAIGKTVTSLASYSLKQRASKCAHNHGLNLVEPIPSFPKFVYWCKGTKVLSSLKTCLTTIKDFLIFEMSR